MGRKTKGEESRSKFIHIRATPNERTVLRDAAFRNHVSVTDLIFIGLQTIGIDFKNYNTKTGPFYRISHPTHFDKQMIMVEHPESDEYRPVWRCHCCGQVYYPPYAKDAEYCIKCGSYFIEEEK